MHIFNYSSFTVGYGSHNDNLNWQLPIFTTFHGVRVMKWKSKWLFFVQKLLTQDQIYWTLCWPLLHMHILLWTFKNICVRKTKLIPWQRKHSGKFLYLHQPFNCFLTNIYSSPEIIYISLTSRNWSPFVI